MATSLRTRRVVQRVKSGSTATVVVSGPGGPEATGSPAQGRLCRPGTGWFQRRVAPADMGADEAMILSRRDARGS
jgi:hypothetical protein